MTTRRRRVLRAGLAAAVVGGLALLGPVQDPDTLLAFLCGALAGVLGGFLGCAAFLGKDRMRP